MVATGEQAGTPPPVMPIFSRMAISSLICWQERTFAFPIILLVYMMTMA